MTPTAEFRDKVRQVQLWLAAAPPTQDERFSCVLLAVRDSLASPAMLRAGQVLFEDYAAVRLCVRAMMKILRRKLCPA
jgi:hypothetical protein